MQPIHFFGRYFGFRPTLFSLLALPALASAAPVGADLELSLVKVQQDGPEQLFHLRVSNVGQMTSKGVYLDIVESSEFSVGYASSRSQMDSLEPGETIAFTRTLSAPTFRTEFFLDLAFANHSDTDHTNNRLLVDRCVLGAQWDESHAIAVKPGGFECSPDYGPAEPSVIAHLESLGHSPIIAYRSRCGIDADGTDGPDFCPNPATGMEHLALEMDLGGGESISAVADIQLDPSVDDVVELAVRDVLTVLSVERDTGVPVRFERRDEILFVARDGSNRFDITYTLAEGADRGVLATGETLTWPDSCGALFPCISDPSDGITFELDVIGQAFGDHSLHAVSVDTPSPAYMLAWATGPWSAGNLNRISLGRSDGGVQLYAWYQPGGFADASSGTGWLRTVFSFYENILGPYPFGDEAGSVAAGPFAGMEHHPYWHVRPDNMQYPYYHFHEAAHGWFGNGVRLACWEDLVLSEGAATYLGFRGLELAFEVPQAQMDQIWAGLADDELVEAQAWPEGCGDVGVVDTLGVHSQHYYRGAFFLRAVEREVGRATFDAVLGTFFQQRVGTAASMQDLIDTIEAETGFDAEPLTQAWLRDLPIPALP